MNKVYAVILVCGLIFVPGVLRAAVENEDVVVPSATAEAADPAATTEPAADEVAKADNTAKPVEVGNKICPVSNEEVGQNGMEPYKMVYKGKAYNLCCAMCVKDFNKDPEKYTKIAEDEVKVQAPVAKD